LFGLWYTTDDIAQLMWGERKIDQFIQYNENCQGYFVQVFRLYSTTGP